MPTPRMRGGRPQLGLAERREVVGADPALARLATGGAQHRGVVTPAAEAWARTDPHPNDSSSGCATTTSSSTDELDARAGVSDQRGGRRPVPPAAGSARSVAGSPMPRKKSSRLSVGLPEQITSIRAVVGEHAEAVRRAAGDERERAGRRGARLAVDLELDLAVEDVERLVLVDLHVHRRVRGRRHQVLGEAVGAAGLGHARHGRHQRVEEPGGLALARPPDQSSSSASMLPSPRYCPVQYLVIDSRHCPGQYVKLLDRDRPPDAPPPRTPSSGCSRCARGPPTSWPSRCSARSAGSGRAPSGSCTTSPSGSSRRASPRAAPEMTGARPRTVYTVTARGRKALRRWLERAAGAAVARVRGDGEGVLRRRRDARAAAGDADVDRRRRPTHAWPSSRRRSSRTQQPEVPFPERRADQPGRAPVPARPRAHRSARGPAGPSTRSTGWRSPTDPGSWDYRPTF